MEGGASSTGEVNDLMRPGKTINEKKGQTSLAPAARGSKKKQKKLIHLKKIGGGGGDGKGE